MSIGPYRRYPPEYLALLQQMQQPTPYPQALGGLGQMLALIGPLMALREQQKREEEDRGLRRRQVEEDLELRRQESERRRLLEAHDFLTRRVEAYRSTGKEPPQDLLAQLDEVGRKLHGLGLEKRAIQVPGEIEQPATPSFQLPTGMARAEGVPPFVPAQPEVRGPGRTEERFVLPGFEAPQIRTVGDLASNLGIKIRKGVNVDLPLSELPKDFDISSLFEIPQQTLQIPLSDGGSLTVTRDELLDLMKSPDFATRILGPSPQKKLEQFEARAKRLQSELDNKLQAIHDAYLKNPHLLNTLIATYNRRLAEIAKHAPEVAGAYARISPAEATALIRETQAERRMSEEERRSLIESRRSTGRGFRIDRIAQANAFFESLMQMGVSQEDALFRTRLRYPDAYGRPSPGQLSEPTDLRQARAELIRAQVRAKEAQAKSQAARNAWQATVKGREVSAGPFSIRVGGQPQGDPKLLQKFMEANAEFKAAQASFQLWQQEVNRLSQRSAPRIREIGTPPTAPDVVGPPVVPTSRAASGPPRNTDQLPPANSVPPGTVYRDEKTGKRYRSDGKKWVEVR